MVGYGYFNEITLIIFDELYPIVGTLFVVGTYYEVQLKNNYTFSCAILKNSNRIFARRFFWLKLFNIVVGSYQFNTDKICTRFVGNVQINSRPYHRSLSSLFWINYCSQQQICYHLYSSHRFIARYQLSTPVGNYKQVM